MTPQDFNSSIRSARATLQNVGLLEGCVYDVALPNTSQFRKDSLTSNSYVEIYEKGLSHSYYNVLLSDLAFFQFSYKAPEEFALAFYPNPRITGSADALSDYEDLMKQRDDVEINEESFSELASLMPAEMYVPRWRYEYSEEQYRKVMHPGAHFHIGMSGVDRWSCSRKLSPHSFLLLMIKFYYPTHWWPRSRFSGANDLWSDRETIERCWETKLVRSLQSDGASFLFNEEERQSFHFTVL